LDQAALRERLRAAQRLADAGQAESALRQLGELQREAPEAAEVAIVLSRTARRSGRRATGEQALLSAIAARPDIEALAVELGVLRADAGDLTGAIDALRDYVGRCPRSPLAWLLLGQMLDDAARPTAEALWARFQSLSSAHAMGVWQSPATTPPHLVDAIRRAARTVSDNRRAVFLALMAQLMRHEAGPALERIELAVRAYVGDLEAIPPDPMQRPRFLYVPGLPSRPYLDPMLQPWAQGLRAAFGDIREEALTVAFEGSALEDFIEVKDGESATHLGGMRPSWEAYFFYRHGRRFDDNHRRCPKTSAVLESIDLMRIPGQTPEICFSVLAPDTHILPHHGVTNARAVMHLPLAVPPDCALHLVDRGVHAWREGELVMFDDTYLHEAWNRSDQVRVILLMDCWNPYLTAAERVAVTRVCEAIGVVDVSLASSDWLSA
jgi:aspartate beta-hydroxylase